MQREPWTERAGTLLWVLLFAAPPLTLAVALACLYTDRDLMSLWLVLVFGGLLVFAIVCLLINAIRMDSGSDFVLGVAILLLLVLFPLVPLMFGHSTAFRHFDPAHHPAHIDPIDPIRFFTQAPGEPFPFLERRPDLRAKIAGACVDGGGQVNGMPVRRYAGTVTEAPSAPGGLDLEGGTNPLPVHPAVLFVRTDDGTEGLLRRRHHSWTHPAKRVGIATVPGNRIDICAVPGPGAAWFPRFGIVGDEPHYAEATKTYAQMFWLFDMPLHAAQGDGS